MQIRANSNASYYLSARWENQASGDTVRVDEWRQQVIRSLTDRLETEHYAPRKIDDSYSEDVWNKFINDLDKNKEIFLADDLRSLAQYKASIDDEMHAHSTQFYDAAVSLFHRRIGEVMELYHSFLAKPVRFSSRRTVLESRKDAAWPKDAAERKAIWEDRLRLMVLKNMVEAKVTKYDRKAIAAAAERTGRSLDVVYKFNSSPEGDDQQFSIYLNEMTGCMDPHSAYFSPVDARTMQEEMSHLYYGVGMELAGKDGELSVQKLMPGGSALKSGLLQAGDKIISVSDKDDQLIPVAGMPLEIVVKMLRGEKGTTVRMQIARPGEASRVITLAREEIQKADAGARAAIIQRDGQKTGYIYLPMFYVDMQNPQGTHSSIDVKKLLMQLKDSGINSLVIDLRNNPGGSLDEVMNMAALFIDHGPLVQLKDRYGINGMTKNPGPGPLYDGPMTVLVNGSSASASEIFAAAMQDYRRALIVGSPTFGKGTAQENVAMGKVADREHNRPAVNYGAIRLSIKKFYRINGGSTQLKGVTPDVLLPDGQDYSTEREKDKPFAMQWDEIAPLAFEPYPSWDSALLQRAAERVSRDPAFSMIRENVKWIDSHHNTPFPLDFKKLRAEMDTLNGHLAQITKARNMAPDNGVRVREQGPSSGNGEGVGNGEWTGQLKKDIYIREAMNILNEMNKK
jgi:carboxyl-terminal processing protease